MPLIDTPGTCMFQFPSGQQCALVHGHAVQRLHVAEPLERVAGSWLNWIETEFAALRYFARGGGTDHRSHTEQNAAIAGYVRWRNARAQPKVNFAVNSPIRTWTDYPAKAA